MASLVVGCLDGELAFSFPVHEKRVGAHVRKSHDTHYCLFKCLEQRYRVVLNSIS